MGILPDEEYNAVLTVLRLAEKQIETGKEWYNKDKAGLTEKEKDTQMNSIKEEEKRLELAEDLFVRFELIKPEDVK